MSTNPLVAPRELPFDLAPFTDIRDEHYRPALEEAFAAHLAEVTAITQDPEPPTFANTIEALERSGRLLHRVIRLFMQRAASFGDAFSQELEAEVGPQLAAHQDTIRLDSALFARVEAVHSTLDDSDLAADARHLVERLHTDFVLAGAGLGDADKATLSDLNSRIASLNARFRANVRTETEDLAVLVDDVTRLDGLSDAVIAAAAEAAAERDLDGRWLITLPLFTNHPYLESLTDRELRREIMAASQARGSRDTEHDNRPVVIELAQLRAQRAELLGFASHVAWVTAGAAAGTAEAVGDLLGRVGRVAARRARAEAEVLQTRFDQLRADAGLEPAPLEAHDWMFVAEKVRASEHSVDTAALRPWFEFERVLADGVFGAATDAFGLTFTERTDLDAPHPDVRIWQVDEANGEPVALFLLDLYARTGKRGGAWMGELVSASGLLDQPTSVITNTLNVSKPPAGQPTLLTFDEVNTLFHEFGHALHGMLGRTRFPSQSGTGVLRDVVELPSQLNELWMLWPSVLERYAVNHETGAPLPDGTVERLRAAEVFNQGFATSEYVAAALIDQAWHSLSAAEAAVVGDVADFEAQVLAEHGLDLDVVPPRYRSTYFEHVFGSSGAYDGGYYNYLWAEVLEADAVEWFTEHGGATRANGDRYRSHILGVGGSRDMNDAYRDFRGRDADPDALLRRRGLVDAA